MSLRWIIAMVMFWLICTLLSNVIEQQDVYTTKQVAQINAMRTQQFTESKEPDVGGVTTTGTNPLTVLNAVYKSLTLEYSFLYDINYTYTEAQCALVSNAKWQTDTVPVSCKIPNVWFLPFSILLYGPLIGVSIFIVLTIWHAIRGGGT